jgi:exopolysaccharide biosynthesis protein
MRRLKYFACGIELIKNSKHNPSSKENVNKKTQVLHRFAGSTADNELFYVQIREDKKTGKKYLMSVYPDNE